MANIVFTDSRLALQNLELFETLADTLHYVGPRIHVHVLPSQRPNNVLVLAWRDARDEVETVEPAFSTLGTSRQSFAGLTNWLAANGWLAGADSRLEEASA